MQLKFSLLDEDDLKLIETMLVRAGLRIFRQLARDGLLGAQPVQAAPRPAPSPPLQTSQWPVEPALREPDPELPVDPKLPIDHEAPPTTPVRDPPVYLRSAPETPFPATKPAEPVWPPKQSPPKRKYRSVQQVCKTVADRPQGYITSVDACDLIGGTSPSGQLSQFVINREVEAVIVANFKPPTKGLPGRLMVNKESLLKRLTLRTENSKRPVRERRSAEIRPD